MAGSTKALLQNFRACFGAPDSTNACSMAPGGAPRSTFKQGEGEYGPLMRSFLFLLAHHLPLFLFAEGLRSSSDCALLHPGHPSLFYTRAWASSVPSCLAHLSGSSGSRANSKSRAPVIGSVGWISRAVVQGPIRDACCSTKGPLEDRWTIGFETPRSKLIWKNCISNKINRFLNHSAGHE